MVDPVRKIADAVLYEGYMLWPYRRSAMKNRQRWNFGGVYPRGHSEGREDDPWQMRTECLVEGEAGAAVDIQVRFLHLVERQLERDGQPLDELTVGGERYLSWQEATEREIRTTVRLGESLSVPVHIPAGSEREELGEGGAIVRSWQGLEGTVEIDSALRSPPSVFRLRVLISNTTPWPGGSREQALERTLCSAHTVLRAPDADFASLTDPPERLRAEAEACRNEGTWPVLVGDSHTLLSSPIILEDNPQIAPESPGDLFDGGEIDQLLVLNILSLTDEEKDEMRASDPRAREILERTEALSPEEMMRLHGRFSDLRQVQR